MPTQQENEDQFLKRLQQEAEALERVLAELREEKKKQKIPAISGPPGKTLAEVFAAEEALAKALEEEKCCDCPPGACHKAASDCEHNPIHDCALKHDCLGCLNDNGVCAYCGKGAPAGRCPICSHALDDAGDCTRCGYHTLPIPDEVEKAQTACDAPLPGEWSAAAATPAFDSMLETAKRSAEKYINGLNEEAVINRFLEWLGKDNLRMAGEAFVSGYCSALEETDGVLGPRASQDLADHYCQGMFDANAELNMQVTSVLEQFAQRPEMQHTTLPASVLKELMDALLAVFERSYKLAQAYQENSWKKD